MSEIIINASIEEVEKVVRALVKEVFHQLVAKVKDAKTGEYTFRWGGIEIEKRAIKNVVMLFFRESNFIDGKDKILSWGIATLTKQKKKTGVSLRLELSAFLEYCEQNFIRYEEMKSQYQDNLAVLNEKLRNYEFAATDYDTLILEWVNRPSVPYENKDEFLEKRGGYISPKTFDRIMKDAAKRKLIQKDENGRWKKSP